MMVMTRRGAHCVVEEMHPAEYFARWGIFTAAIALMILAFTAWLASLAVGALFRRVAARARRTIEAVAVLRVVRARS